MSDISQKQRDKLAKQGKALPDGSFPIRNRDDLSNAIKAVGRAKDYDTARRFIIKRAKELNATSMLPDEWKETLEKASKADASYNTWLTKYREKRAKKQKAESPSLQRAKEVLENNSSAKNVLSYSNKDVRNMSIKELVEARNTIYEDINSSSGDYENLKSLLEEDLTIIDNEMENRKEHKRLKLSKALKGTPTYEEWLRKYKQHFAESGDFFIKDGEALKILEMHGNKAVVETNDGEVSELDVSKDLKELEDREKKEMDAAVDVYSSVPELKVDRDSVKAVKSYLNFKGNPTMGELRSQAQLFYFCPDNADTQLWAAAVNEASSQHRRYSLTGRETRATLSDVTRQYTKYLAAVYPDKFSEIVSMNKAQKGTAEYEEWLRKYREKRGRKIQEEQNSRRHSLEKVEEIFDRRKQAEDSKAQDIRVQEQVSSAVADLKVSPEILERTTRPVFANLFGHYPAKPLVYTDRVVTSPVEQIDVALAYEPEEISDEIWNSDEWIATEKVDGCRGTLICTPEATRFTARRQQYATKQSTDYTNNVPHLRDLDLYSILGDTVIDTELVASNPLETIKGKKGDSLASTMSVLGQEKDLSVCVEKMKDGPLLSFAFDIQRYKGQDLRSLPYLERMKYLDEAMSAISAAGHGDLIKQVARQNEGESKQDFFLRVTGANGEGLVLAKADGPYIAFDRKNRLKAKRQVELTLQVMDIEEGKGRNAGSAGAFIMGAYINGVLTPISNLNVGDDALRKDAWENKASYIGSLIEVKSMQMTTPAKGEVPRLRHARWKTPGQFRVDKESPDDISNLVAILQRRNS